MNLTKSNSRKVDRENLRNKFCLTNSEGGEEVGAKSVWV